MSWGASPVMSSPSKTTRPSVGSYAPVMTLNSVVLPAPFGPMSPTDSPRSIEKVTSSTATTPPNRFVRPSPSSNAI